LLLSPPDGSANYRIGGQRDNGVNATLWRLLKSFIGVNSGPCEREWTRECEHSFANPAYRPGPKKRWQHVLFNCGWPDWHDMANRSGGRTTEVRASWPNRQHISRCRMR